jgi:hypothetical protein
VAQIIRDYGDDFVQKFQPLKQHQRVLNALKICRTAALGGHVERCDNEKCQHERIAYNSCRNRHCPSPRRILEVMFKSIFKVNFTIT